jgi:hypothetical protein
MEVYSVVDIVTSGKCLPSRCLAVVICVTVYTSLSNWCLGLVYSISEIYGHSPHQPWRWRSLKCWFLTQHWHSWSPKKILAHLLVIKAFNITQTCSLYEYHGFCDCRPTDYNLDIKMSQNPAQVWIQRFLGPEIGTSSIDWAQLSRFHLKMETESSLQNVF